MNSTINQYIVAGRNIGKLLFKSLNAVTVVQYLRPGLWIYITRQIIWLFVEILKCKVNGSGKDSEIATTCFS